MSDSELDALREKAERYELRARYTEARLRIIEAEIAIIQKRKTVMDLKELEDS